MQLGETVGRGHCSAFAQHGHAPSEPLADEALNFSHPQAHSPVAQCGSYSADRSSTSLTLAYIPPHMEAVASTTYGKLSNARCVDPLLMLPCIVATQMTLSRNWGVLSRHLV